MSWDRSKMEFPPQFHCDVQIAHHVFVMSYCIRGMLHCIVMAFSASRSVLVLSTFHRISLNFARCTKRLCLTFLEPVYDDVEDSFDCTAVHSRVEYFDEAIL